MDILSVFLSSLPSLGGGFNFLDIIILCIVLFYVHEGYTLGFTLATLDLVSFIISFIAALQFYTNFASFLTTFFALPIGIANAVGFFIIAFISEIVLAILIRRGLRYLPGLPRNRFTDWLKGANHWLGIVPGLVSAFIILSFLLTIIVTFPSSPIIKSAVNESTIGAKLLANTSLFEKQLDTLLVARSTKHLTS
ncbi:MAG: CvpA family protein [Candidatus Levybacteria bacterium]|nr:CvpA family protein [Candidatus Levybacteria bacterium]